MSKRGAGVRSIFLATWMEWLDMAAKDESQTRRDRRLVVGTRLTQCWRSLGAPQRRMGGVGATTASGRLGRTDVFMRIL